MARKGSKAAHDAAVKAAATRLRNRAAQMEDERITDPTAIQGKEVKRRRSSRARNKGAARSHSPARYDRPITDRREVRDEVEKAHRSPDADAQEAVSSYSGGKAMFIYAPVNARMRGAPYEGPVWKKDSPKVIATEQGLRRAINQQEPLQRPIQVFRGLDAPGTVAPGEVVHEPAFASTSMDPDHAALFANNFNQDLPKQPVLMRVTVPAGTRVFYKRGFESEVILPPGGTFRIKSEAKSSPAEVKELAEVLNSPTLGRIPLVDVEYVPPKAV